MSDNSLNILCFGDSLTQGFHNYGLGESPYSETLEERLNAEFPDREIRIRTSGVPGDVASSSSFQRRFNQEGMYYQVIPHVIFNNYLKLVQVMLTWIFIFAVNAVPYDWVIILGGTNDLGRLLSVEKVFDALKSYWNTAIMNGSKVLALTVPECQAKPEWLEINRHGLNQQILFHSQPNFYTFDLYSHIPYHSLTEAERTLYWDDGLHLTADGYAWMGEHIANGLIQILKKEDM